MNWNDVLQLSQANLEPDRKVTKTKEEWKAQLTSEQFHVTREHGTERAFTGEFCELFAPGVYGCICCGTHLFDSTTKFNSSSGWPSFTSPIKDNVISYHKDTSWGMTRIEVLCNVCDAHLGHVFPDGPPPSGLRFCINSASLDKIG
ncbi:peptide-methionine (R)-S-oxide reductase MsrB [Flavihumibacter solisilvae]|uniref:peptide-methionine (R)-S-oxide reductase n=1 Tax=Flavihumibacter solisilvae TaxID=1349421 RepID=A0A0C1L1S5_9BACT|nr:peptide-methionine (R)-S-oxide reductase MsrB [Flavihumibacter solisilvae]KIC93962.1 PilB [Flavihumibacter solisilvae]